MEEVCWTRGLRLAFLGLVVIPVLGCGDEVVGDRAPVEQTRLSGVAFLDRLLVDRPVRVYGVNDRAREALGEGVTDEEGRWSVELGFLAGPFVVEVESSPGVHVTRIVASSRGLSLKDVMVTPFTHLAAGYTRWLLGNGKSSEEAAEKVRTLLYGHLGGLDLDRILPVYLERVEEDRGDEASGLLDDAMLSGILIAGFKHQAETMALEQGLSPDGAVNLFSLVDRLAADIQGDGQFDGFSNGPLKLGAKTLSGDTFRNDYARSVLAFLASDKNKTVYREEDLEVLAKDIATRTTEIFPHGAPSPLDQSGPELSIRLLEASGEASDGPFGSSIRVEVEASDPSGVAELKVSVIGGSDALFTEDEAEVVSRIECTLRTALLGAGLHELEVIAVDRIGKSTRQVVSFTVEEAGPDISVRWLDAEDIPFPGALGAEARLKVEALDSSGVAELRLSVVGGSRSEDLFTEDEDSAIERISCMLRSSLLEEGAHQLEVVAVDKVGNTTRRVIDFLVDHTAPVLIVDMMRWTQAVSTPFVVTLSDSPNGRPVGGVPLDVGIEQRQYTSSPYAAPRFLSTWIADRRSRSRS